MDFEKYYKQQKEAELIKCPECGFVEDDLANCEDLVTHWGSDVPVSWDCPECDAKLLVEEFVKRTYNIKKIKEYWAIQITKDDGSAYFYDESYSNTENYCQQVVKYLKKYQQDERSHWSKVKKIEVIKIEI